MAGRGAAAEQRGNTIKRFGYFYLQVEAMTVLYVPYSLEAVWSLEYQASMLEQILYFESFDLYCTSPESGATVVQISRLETDDLPQHRFQRAPDAQI